MKIPLLIPIKGRGFIDHGSTLNKTRLGVLVKGRAHEELEGFTAAVPPDRRSICLLVLLTSSKFGKLFRVRTRRMLRVGA